jgi:Glycosyl hydrolase family 9/Cellulase N-terminal ig-like domain
VSQGADQPHHSSPTIERRELLQGTSLAILGGLLPLPAFAQQGTRDSMASAASLWKGRWPVRPLLKADLSRLLDEQCRAKAVHARQMVDDMESDTGWVASRVVTLQYTSERSRSGKRALRFSTALRNEDYIRSARSANGSFTGQGVLFDSHPFAAYARRTFATAQDWSAFNRISLWCYVHPTRNPANTLSLQFVCEGAPAGPMDPVAVHYIGDLKPGEWNHLVWEISEHRRDQVTEFILFQPLSGISVAAAGPQITYDFDELCIERVDAERVQGWEVTPGKIAYSHLGYQPAAVKIAVAPEGQEAFDLVHAVTGDPVATFAAQSQRNTNGTFRLLDFSSYSRPGSYRLRYGAITTDPFPIAERSWRTAVEATLNAFYGLRCGFPVPGQQDACHQDVSVEFNGERRSVGGGWHDAANLTQGPYRTHLSIYALAELHDALLRTGSADLAARALEEALWGIDWSMRMRFGPGLRTLYGSYSYWTDNLTGTLDDVLQGDARGKVGRDDFQNTLAALAATRGARLVKSRDPALAAALLKAAREDFAVVTGSVTPPREAKPLEINEPSWRDQIGYLTLTAVELYRATGDTQYRSEAVRLARWLTEVQERRFVDGIGIAGYFYEDAGRTRIVHEYHNSFEDCGLLAFAALCEAFDDHPDWMEWYAGLAIYAEHFCLAGSRASAPFDIIPAAVWRRADLDAPQPLDRTGMMLAKKPSPVFPTPPTPEMVRRQMGEMFEHSTALAPDYRLRIFPLWYDHIRKGATTVHMSKTIGLTAAAAVMRRSDLSDLASRQLQWVIGANPFSRSLMYGVGHDFWQNFTVALPNIVGGLGLGFNSYAEDAPAWGNNAVFPYKEMWIYSSCRIALNLARIGTGAMVGGTAPAGAIFKNVRTGSVTRVRPGSFSLQMASGDYDVAADAVTRRVSLADGSAVKLKLDSRRWLALTGNIEQQDNQHVIVSLQATGSGRHLIEVRAWNAEVGTFDRTIELKGSPVRWQLSVQISKVDMPWLLLVGPQGRPSERIQFSGRSPVAVPG